MFDQYLVTGATGFLGRAVAEELVHVAAIARDIDARRTTKGRTC